jgi:hypothetical protein
MIKDFGFDKNNAFEQTTLKKVITLEFLIIVLVKIIEA